MISSVPSGTLSSADSFTHSFNIADKTNWPLEIAVSLVVATCTGKACRCVCVYASTGKMCACTMQVRHTRCSVWTVHRRLLASYRVPLTGCFDSLTTRKNKQVPASRSACRQLRLLASRNTSKTFLSTLLPVRSAVQRETDNMPLCLDYVWQNVKPALSSEVGWKCACAETVDRSSK